MSCFVADIPRAPKFAPNQPVLRDVSGADYYPKRDRIPSQDALYESEFDPKFIPLEGGRQLLTLKKPLTLRIEPQTLNFVVVDWGIKMDCFKLGDLPREIARRFLRLWNAAENEALNEQDQADWLRVCDYVDFQSFSIDRSAPHYVEGTLCQDNVTKTVEWSNGVREKLTAHAGRALAEINVGERFSAFAKLGKENKTLSLERVSLVEKLHDGGDLESWPTKN